MPWTETTRRHYVRKGAGYASDTTDAEWALIASFMPKAQRLGRRRKVDLRRVVDAIFYIASSGCKWRMLPKDFPPRSAVQGCFCRWRDDGRWKSINHAGLFAARERQGRDASPSAGIIDSHPSASLGTRASRPRKAAAHAALTRANPSRDASAIS